MGCGGRYYILRWILGALILAFVFGAGIKLGEFKEQAWGNGYGMMQRGYGNDYGRTIPGYGMMQEQGRSNADAYYGYGMMGGAR